MIQFQANDALLLQRLSNAGWVPDNEAADFGLVQLTVQNGDIILVVDHEESLATLGLSISSEARDAYLRLSISYGSEIDRLMSLLMSWQDRISASNLSDFLSDIVSRFDRTYVAHEDDEWQKVQPALENVAAILAEFSD